MKESQEIAIVRTTQTPADTPAQPAPPPAQPAPAEPAPDPKPSTEK